jgi:hypothetical protein
MMENDYVLGWTVKTVNELALDTLIFISEEFSNQPCSHRLNSFRLLTSTRHGCGTHSFGCLGLRPCACSRQRRNMHCRDPSIARIFREGQRDVHGEEISFPSFFPVVLPDASDCPCRCLRGLS